jgi:hypothetical protein
MRFDSWYNRRMLTGFRILWRALIHFWDESLLMIRANVTWFVISLPLYLLTVAICGLFIPGGNPEAGENIWPWVLSAFILVAIPGPTSAGVYAIANHVVNEETPEFSMFWRGIKLLWKKALVTYVIGAAVFGGLIFNTVFYMQVSTGLLQAVAILWLYGIIYWLSLQAYLLPMLVQAALPPPPQLSGDDGWSMDDAARQARSAPPPPPEPEFIPLVTLYKRAAILALANPLMTLVLLFGLIVALALSSFALPVYPLLVMSLAALINCRGLRALREKYANTEWTSELRGDNRHYEMKGQTLYQATESLKGVGAVPARTFYVVNTPDGSLGRDLEGFYAPSALRTIGLTVPSRRSESRPVEARGLKSYGDGAASQRTTARNKLSGEYSKLVLLMTCGTCGYESPVETQPGQMVRECYRCGVKNSCQREKIAVTIDAGTVEV